ncbi:hypothetical protein Tco_0892127 [Tanacetum coccineum]|uniref:Uncharacterized protein n=1 Tax=Tanacetum coccineum TaxID=301880 RepID=A0ABQ5C577_9ASTR
MHPAPQQFIPVYAALIHHQQHHTPVNPLQQPVSPQSFISPSVTQQPQVEFPQLDSGLVVPTFQQGENPIDCINKAMSFLSAVASRQTQSFAGTRNKGIATTSRGNYAASQPRVVKCYNSGQILDEEQLAFLADPIIEEALVAQQTISQNSAFQTEDLNAYDSDCDDISSAKAVLMANLSSCDSDILSEEPNSDTYLNDMINQDVQEMPYSEQTHIVDFTDNEITSDSNIISYSQYLQESQNTGIQDTNSSTPNDLLVLSLVEQMTDHVANLDKKNQTNKMVNESLTVELERYKERVTIFEQRQNVDLNKREKLIDSQMDDLIRNRNAKLVAFQQEIDTLKETLSNHVKENESLSKTLTGFKTKSNEKESKYIDKEIVLEKQNKELENIICKMYRSAQAMHMLTKPQEHDVIFVIDDEETLILEEESRSKMLDKQNDPISIKQKINISPIDYSKLNKIKEDFGKDRKNQTNKCLKKAQRIKPTLYDGSVIAKEHDVIFVIDDEETLILEEESRSKMLDKQNDPISIKQKINISPIDYSKLNKIKEDFGKCLVTKKELSAEQAFWLKHSNYNPDTSVKSHTPVRIEAPSELPKVSLVNESLKKLKYQLASFDKVVKKRITSDAITADKNVFEIQIKQLRINNDKLLKQIMSQEIMHIAVNSVDILNVNKSCVDECNKCLELETNLLKKKDLIGKYSQEKDTVIRKLKEMIKSLSGKDGVENVKKDIDEIEKINIEFEHNQFESIRKTRVQSKEHCASLIAQINEKSAENSDLNAQLQEKVFAIAALKNKLRKLKGKNVVDTAVSKPNATIAPRIFKLDIEPISHRLKNNRDAHEVYLEKTIENTDTLCGLVECDRK